MIQVLNMKDLTPDTVDYCICIMRSDRFLKPGITHMPQLAPSWELFNKYRQWEKSDEWCEDVFNNVYVPEFMESMCSKESRDALNWLWAQSYLCKVIQIGCTCKVESMCHRSVVGGILEGTGVKVSYESNASYSNYYNLWVSTDSRLRGGI